MGMRQSQMLEHKSAADTAKVKMLKHIIGFPVSTLTVK